VREAATQEDATDKSPVTPGPLAPARELLGEMLLDAGRPADALAEFETVMRKEPGRFRAIAGAMRAAAMAKQDAKARNYAAALVALAKGSDGKRPALTEAKTIASGK
jgi:hypothetical protein